MNIDIIRLDDTKDKESINKIKKDYKYDINIYKGIYNHKLIFIIIEKLTLSDYTDIDIILSPIYVMYNNKYPEFWKSISKGIDRYINLTDKKHISIQLKNNYTYKNMKEAITDIGFVHNKQSIYSNIYIKKKVS